MDASLKENMKNQEDFQYISVSNIKYPYTITQASYNPVEFISSIINPKQLALVKRKSGVKDCTKNSKAKKCKKQKNKIEQPTLSLSKQDTKMGIYAMKPPKEEKEKKQKPKLPQQIHQQQQKILKQVDALTKMKVNQEESIETQAQQKNKKGKKSKGNVMKKDKDLNEEEILPSNAGNDQNKQVDNLIKQIKNKKENQEKSLKKETIKICFTNKYKYLFTLDPAQRLKLRDQSVLSLPIDIIDILFQLIGTNSSAEGEKEKMKDSVTLIDNLIEIASVMKDITFLNGIINAVVLYFNAHIVNDDPLISEQALLFLLNTLYSFIKLKVETHSNELFSKDQLKPLNDKLIQLCLKAIDSLTNDHKLLKQNDKIMNSLIPYILMEIIFINDSNPNEPSNGVLSSLISKVSMMTLSKDSYDNFDHFKIHYDNMNLFNKLNMLFDIKKEMLYSLNIKTSKYIEAALNQMQIKLMTTNLQQYSLLIEDLLVCYLNNFDLFYVIDYKLYDDVFALLMVYCDKFSSVINYQKIFKDFSFRTYSFELDDSLIKFILFIMKFIKLFNGVLASSSSPNEEVAGFYVAFFNKILDFILDTNQLYLKEKYTALLHKQIEGHMNLPFISLTSFNYLKATIESMAENEADFSKSMKNVKELTNFYKKYSQLKQHIITYLNSKEAMNNTKGNICSLFFYNFFSITSKSDLELLQNNIDYQSVLNIDDDTISFLMNYFIEDELNNLSQIEKVLYEKSKVPVDTVINRIIVDSIKGSSVDLKKIHFGLKLSQKMAKQFDIETIVKHKNDVNKILLDSLVLYYINSDWKDIDWDQYYSWKGDEIITEIRDVNNQTKSYKGSYFNKGDNEFTDQLIPFLLQIKKLQALLSENPSYYQADDISIENEPIEKDKKYPATTSKENEGEGEQLKAKEEEPPKDNKAKPTEEINFDIIVIAFNEIFNHPLFSIKENTSQEILFLFNQIQKFAQRVLSNELIFFNLKQNKPLLVSFLKRFIDFKHQLFTLKEQLSLSLKQLISIANAEEINAKLTQIEIISQCENNITELISTRCCEQLPYLYPEEEIYNLLFTKDRKFLLSVTNNLRQVYKYRILNEQKIESLLNKVQNEDEDLLESVIYEIFGKNVIQYLEYPEELIDFLTRMNEGLKYNLTLTKKKLYEAVFPFFYIWKNIMSKLENGFRLYTSDKQHVTVIENYKTLLKFIVNYLERNSKLYEMFLLIMVSLLHLIDEQQQDDSNLFMNSGSFETFKDEDLTDSFDENTFQFLLANLFKFVKIFPSLVKFYYDESKNKLKNVFKKLISSMILPKLLRDLNERIKSNEKILKDNKINLADSISPHFIQFYFSINEEIKFQIEIKVPPIFPLKKIDISMKCNASIDERKMLNISMNLNHTLNSSIDNITDNLIIWTEDVKQLIIKGHEPCPICYFYLHTTDKSLPGLYCHTCKKKFHGLCIKEWFKNLKQKGQNPSCPMCRSEWRKKF